MVATIFAAIISEKSQELRVKAADAGDDRDTKNPAQHECVGGLSKDELRSRMVERGSC